MKKIILALVSILAFPAFLFAATATWVDNSDNETGFILQSCLGVCTDTSTWAEVARTTQDVTTLTFTIPTLPTSYRVIAYNSFGSALPSNIFTASAPNSATIFTIEP